MKNTSEILFFQSKKAFLFLFLIITGFKTYSQTYERPPNGPRSVKNERDDAGRRQGTWKYYYYDGVLRTDINFVNNLMEGAYIRYSHEGKIVEEVNYLAGKRDGEYKKYYVSGQVSIEGKYEMGVKDDKWTEYYEDGSIKREMEFKKGMREGEWKTFDRKGAVIKSVTYKNGVDVNAAPPVPPKEKTVPGKKTKGK